MKIEISKKGEIKPVREVINKTYNIDIEYIWKGLSKCGAFELNNENEEDGIPYTKQLDDELFDLRVPIKHGIVFDFNYAHTLSEFLKEIEKKYNCGCYLLAGGENLAMELQIQWNGKGNIIEKGEIK